MPLTAYNLDSLNSSIASRDEEMIEAILFCIYGDEKHKIDDWFVEVDQNDLDMYNTLCVDKNYTSMFVGKRVVDNNINQLDLDTFIVCMFNRRYFGKYSPIIINRLLLDDYYKGKVSMSNELYTIDLK